MFSIPSQSTLPSPAHIQAQSTLRFSIQVASLSLLYYDYALTWTREVKHFWRRKPSFSTFLYFFCRYGMIANVVYTIAVARHMKFISCTRAYQLCSVLSVFGRTGVLMVWGIRTYAIFNKNRGVLAFFAALGSARLVLAIIRVPFVSCSKSAVNPFVNVPGDLSAILTIVYEILCGACALVQCYHLLKSTESVRLYSSRETLAHLLMQQGLIYLIGVCLVTLATLVLYAFKQSVFASTICNAFTLPVSGVMTCRFLIYLREWDYSTTHTSSEASDLSSLGPIEFHQETDRLKRRSTWSDAIRSDPLLRFEPQGDRGKQTEEPTGMERV